MSVGSPPVSFVLGTEIDPQNRVCLQGRNRSRVLNSGRPAHRIFFSLRIIPERACWVDAYVKHRPLISCGQTMLERLTYIACLVEPTPSSFWQSRSMLRSVLRSMQRSSDQCTDAQINVCGCVCVCGRGCVLGVCGCVCVSVCVDVFVVCV